MSEFQGSMTAIVTPMTKDGVDYDALAKLIERQLDGGIQGIVSVGTTGESATLSVEEHVNVIKKTIDVVAGRVPVIAGAGGNSTSEAIQLSKASASGGAEGLLQVCPYYNKPTQRGMIEHFKAIAATTKLPIVLYNVPGRTSSDLSVEATVELSKVDNIVAIKDATGDMIRGAEIIASTPDDFDVLSGDDFTSFSLYALGGKGVISVVSNVTPRWVSDMWLAVKDNNWTAARELHYKMLPLVKLLFKEANPIPAKAALSSLGYIEPTVRLPLVNCSPELTKELEEWLKAADIL